MKQIVCFLLSALMVCSFSGCGAPATQPPLSADETAGTTLKITTAKTTTTTATVSTQKTTKGSIPILSVDAACPDYSDQWLFDFGKYTIPATAVNDAVARTIIYSLAEQTNHYPRSIAHYTKDNTWEFTLTDYDPTELEEGEEIWIDGGCIHFIVDGDNGEIQLAFACE